MTCNFHIRLKPIHVYNCVFYRLWQREPHFVRGYAILQLKKLEDLSDAATRCTWFFLHRKRSPMSRRFRWLQSLLSPKRQKRKSRKVVEERSMLRNMLHQTSPWTCLLGRCWICKSHCCSTVLHARTALFRVRGVTARHHSCHSLAGALESWRDGISMNWTGIGHAQRCTCVLQEPLIWYLFGIW